MKKALFIFTVAAGMAACNSTPNSTTDQSKIISPSDTAGLAEYRTWKQQELVNGNEAKSVVAYGGIEPAHKEAVTYAPAKYTPVKSTAHSSSRTVSDQTGTRSSESGHTAKTVHKKGWSKAAKGAVIGAGSGAVAGAIINKRNRAVGAVVGGVVGGGVGYGIGRHMDKKDGRY